MGSETHTGMSTPPYTHTDTGCPHEHAQVHVWSHTPLLLVPSLRQVSGYCKRLGRRGRTAKLGLVYRLLSYWDDAPRERCAPGAEELEQGKDWGRPPVRLHTPPAHSGQPPPDGRLGACPLPSDLGSSLRSQQRGAGRGARTTAEESHLYSTGRLSHYYYNIL